MHIEAMPYRDQLYIHADQIESRINLTHWDFNNPVHIEISIVYSAVIIRKLWEHYKTLYLAVGFSLDENMPGLQNGNGAPQTKRTFVHRIIHSQEIDTSEQSKANGVRFRSDHPGWYVAQYQDILHLIRSAAEATSTIG